jgi:hypothetical protein
VAGKKMSKYWKKLLTCHHATSNRLKAISAFSRSSLSLFAGVEGMELSEVAIAGAARCSW